MPAHVKAMTVLHPLSRCALRRQYTGRANRLVSVLESRPKADRGECQPFCCLPESVALLLGSSDHARDDALLRVGAHRRHQSPAAALQDLAAGEDERRTVRPLADCVRLAGQVALVHPAQQRRPYARCDGRPTRWSCEQLLSCLANAPRSPGPAHNAPPCTTFGAQQGM